MTSKSRINIVSKLAPEYNSSITVDDITYHIQTEDMGSRTSKINTRIYLKGEIVFTKTGDYSHLKKTKTFPDKLSEFMQKQHKSAINLFLIDQSKKQKRKSQYFDEVKQLLRRGNGKSALNTLRHALEKFPADPFLLSYYGCLLSVIENRPLEGTEICRDALVKLDNSMPFGSEFFYPAFYLNLGRSYLKIDKKEAIKAFKTGLKHDPENHDILWELKKLGTRRRPTVPFLKRSNPLNKYIGMILNKASR